MIGFGATACLAKSSEARDVLHAIHLASRGMHVLPGATEGETVAEPAGPAPLTPREAEVLELLQGGHSNAEIAADLHVGIETVRTHARNIYRKLGVTSRLELVEASPRARAAFEAPAATPPRPRVARVRDGQRRRRAPAR